MGRLTTARMRLGKIGFLNVLPIYYPLEQGIIPHHFEIFSGSPARLNRLLAHGCLDVSAVSSIEVAQRPERYFVLPDLSISSRGPVMSVLLMSRIPVEELQDQSILMTAKSETSVALLKLLLRLRLDIEEISYHRGSIPASINSNHPPVAFLAIGDEALQFADHRLYPYRLDLGDAWQGWTGLPFVFGLWAIRKDTLSKHRLRVKRAAQDLSNAKHWSVRHRELICRIAEETSAFTLDRMRSYYSHLYFDLGTEELKGLRLFFRLLHEANEIPSLPKTELLAPLAEVA